MPENTQPHQSAPSPDSATPPTTHRGAALIDRRTTPLGVLPRHLQLWVLIGIALVMVGIMSLSGTRGQPRSSSAAAAASLAPQAVEPNPERIHEYEQRIQEQAQRLATEQAELRAAKEVLGITSTAGSTSTRTETYQPPPTNTNNDSLPQERAQRAYRSLFADNVAFSRGQLGATPARDAAPSLAPAVAPALPSLPPSLSPLLLPPSPPWPASVPMPAIPAGAQAAATASAPSSSASPTPAVTPPPAAGERTYRISEGSIIETVLTNRLDGTFAGPVNCLVTTPVYAADHQHLLIPAGARVLGDATAVTTFGQSRLAVAFRRLLLPNARRVELQSFHGLNQIGETGLRDLVNYHYAQIFGASLAIGAIGGLAQLSTTNGLTTTPFDAYRQGSATSLAQSSAHILDRFLNILPTVTIREGHRIKIYLANDLDVPEYRDAISPAGGRS